MKFDKETVALIEKRSGKRCEICGGNAYTNQIHHRRPRGMGGSKDPLVGSVSNGVLVHIGCHREIEINRTNAREKGWLVYQTEDPSKAPFKKHDGWVLLSSDGDYTMIKAPEDLSS